MNCSLRVKCPPDNPAPATVFALNHSPKGHTVLPYCGDCARAITDTFASVATFEPPRRGA